MAHGAKAKRSEATLALAAAIEKLAQAMDRRTAIEAAKPVERPAVVTTEDRRIIGER